MSWIVATLAEKQQASPTGPSGPFLSTTPASPPFVLMMFEDLILSDVHHIRDQSYLALPTHHLQPKQV